MRKMMPVARRVLRKSDILMYRIRKIYARALSEDPDATLDDIREAVTTLEETERTARQVLGSAHPMTKAIEQQLSAFRP